MSMTVNKTDNGVVRRMTLAGVTTGTLVGLHKAGMINTTAADAFISNMGNAIKNGDKATLKEGGKTLLEGAKNIGSKVYNAGKEFLAKDWAAQKEIITNKGKSLWDGAKNIGSKVLDAGKEFWAKDAAGKKATLEKIAKNPSVQIGAAITAGFIALGLIAKAIKNNKSEA